jgi:uncharacterized protein YjgD (DUF1641 family)
MARPIPLETPRADSREDLILRLEQAPAQHAEAVLSGFEVLQGLHDRGVLELLRAILGGSDMILESLVGAMNTMNTPDATRSIRNLIVLAKVFGSIDPERLKRFAQVLPETLASVAQAEQLKAPGPWDALRMICSKDFRLGLAMLDTFLVALRRSFRSEKND